MRTHVNSVLDRELKQITTAAPTPGSKTPSSLYLFFHFLFLKIVLLRHDLHRMKYRDFVCTVLPVLTNAYPCVAPSLLAPNIFLSPPESFLMLFQSVPSNNHGSDFYHHRLNLTILGFHTNRIMHQVLFVIGFFHSVQCF